MSYGAIAISSGFWGSGYIAESKGFSSVGWMVGGSDSIYAYCVVSTGNSWWLITSSLVIYLSSSFA